MERNLHLERLPPEVRVQSISFAPPKAVCNLMLTSSSMRTLAGNPKLWSGMKVNKQKVEQEGLAKLFSINRFRKITKIDLSGMEFTSERLLENLNAILSSTVKDLNLDKVLLGGVPAQLLARVAGHLTKISISTNWNISNDLNLTTEQCIAILETCVTSSKLVEVKLGDVNLREIPSEFLGHAIGHLHTINLDRCDLQTDQRLAILKNCISSSALTNVTLKFFDLK